MCCYFLRNQQSKVESHGNRLVCAYERRIKNKAKIWRKKNIKKKTKRKRKENEKKTKRIERKMTYPETFEPLFDGCLIVASVLFKIFQVYLGDLLLTPKTAHVDLLFFFFLFSETKDLRLRVQPTGSTRLPASKHLVNMVCKAMSKRWNRDWLNSTQAQTKLRAIFVI